MECALTLARDLAYIWPRCPHQYYCVQLLHHISIKTGHFSKKAIENNMLTFLSKTLIRIATETEITERKFIARWAQYLNKKCYFRFNVEQRLQDVGLTEYKK